FFQAEDGIRDFHVTGVQTCALPIFTPDRMEKRQNGRRFKENDEESFTLTSQDRHGVAIGQANAESTKKYRIRKLTQRECFRLQRSEERRVGKECRSRGRPQR